MVIVTILAAVWNTSEVVSSTVTQNSNSAEAATQARRTINSIGSFLRTAKLSTMTAEAVSADVTALRATSVGEWIPCSEGVERPGIQFVSASGLLSMNAALNTAPRRLTVEMEAGESANGIDDDGDGLVDEKQVVLTHDLSQVAVLCNVEECVFSLTGRIMTVRVRCVRSDSRGHVFRAQIERGFYLRNN